MKNFFPALAIFLISGTLAQAETPKTMLTLPGKAVLTEDFSGAKIPAHFATGKGAWSITDGALRGVELEKDKHAATVRTPLEFHNAVARFDFKFDGGRVIHFSVNGPQGHVCRVTINPKGFVLRRDLNKKKPGDKAVTLGNAETTFKQGKWYTMVVEIHGDTLLARVDRTVVFGSDAGLDTPKSNFGFPIAGDSASIDNVAIYTAERNPKWPAIAKRLKGQLSE